LSEGWARRQQRRYSAAEERGGIAQTILRRHLDHCVLFILSPSLLGELDRNKFITTSSSDFAKSATIAPPQPQSGHF